jgi:ribosomal protein S18 acetylase RimI-like enzyme
MRARTTVPASLVWATSIDVLPADREIERRDGYLVVRSPSNLTHYWGNMLVFDELPGPGDAARWERLFAEEFADDRLVAHVTFAWDRIDGGIGSADDEFISRGYELEKSVGLIAPASAVTEHPRANREVEVRPLNSQGDDELWAEVLALWVANRDEERFDEASYRRFSRDRLRDLRELFSRESGSWYVALLPGGELAGSCGIVVAGERARYQAVDTAPAYRRRGICSRLVVEAAHDATGRWPIRQFVIVADPDYHALGIYESLGFRQLEHTAGVCRQPVR